MNISESIFFRKNEESRYRHLKDKDLAIVCDTYVKEDFAYILPVKDDFFKNAVEISYKWDKKKNEEYNFKNQGPNTYVISNIDSKNKFSRSFLDCTTVFASGISKNTGERISFLTHQNPSKIILDKNIQAHFIEDFSSSLEDLKNQCEENTIDIVILGGNKDINYKKDLYDLNINEKISQKEINEINDNCFKSFYDRYEKQIKLLRKIIFEKFNFYPEVASGPNANFEKEDYLFINNETDVFCDTKKGHIYELKRKNEEIYNESFNSKDLEKQIKKYS